MIVGCQYLMNVKYIFIEIDENEQYKILINFIIRNKYCKFLVLNFVQIIVCKCLIFYIKYIRYKFYLCWYEIKELKGYLLFKCLYI